MTGVDQVLAHNAADLTATVEAGITVSRLQEVLAEHGQFLAIDPPLPDRATIGGTLAVGWSGPMTWQNWSPRDIVIGMRTVMTDGTITKTGGQVVKNVSGYDMARMHIGALGDARHHCGGVVQAHTAPCPAGDSAWRVIRFRRELPRRRAGGISEAVSFPWQFPLCTDISQVWEDVATEVKVTTIPLWSVSEDEQRAFRRQTDDVASICKRSGALQSSVIDGDDAAKMWRTDREISDGPTRPLQSPGIRASVLPADIPGRACVHAGYGRTRPA